MGQRIAFIGLGVMGKHMAAHLARVGHDLVVYNRTAARATEFVAAHGGLHGPTPMAAAQAADFVLVCVGNDEHVREVLLGPQGALAGMKPGALLIDHSTTSAQLARDLSREGAKQKIGVLDAPVSGGEKGAEQGVLTVMVGGRPDHFAQAQPIFDAYAKHAQLLGPAGSGQLAKMVNQICIAGVLQGLAEGLHFAELAGLDAEAVVAVISQGAAQSWQMVNRHRTMIEQQFDFGFAVDWMRKDLGYALSEARRNGASLPLTALVDQFYAEVQAMGGARWDTSSLIARLRSAQYPP